VGVDPKKKLRRRGLGPFGGKIHKNPSLREEWGKLSMVRGHWRGRGEKGKENRGKRVGRGVQKELFPKRGSPKEVKPKIPSNQERGETEGGIGKAWGKGPV